jgi:hypothetical protein
VPPFSGHALIARLRALFRAIVHRDDVESEIQAEFQHHSPVSFQPVPIPAALHACTQPSTVIVGVDHERPRRIRIRADERRLGQKLLCLFDCRCRDESCIRVAPSSDASVTPNRRARSARYARSFSTDAGVFSSRVPNGPQAPPSRVAGQA